MYTTFLYVIFLYYVLVSTLRYLDLNLLLKISD